MGFDKRIQNAKRIENVLLPFLENQHFLIEHTGYERYVADAMKMKLKVVHDNPTVRFLRYMPDCFAIYNNDYFFIEFKYMDTPIYSDNRVKKLQNITGIKSLSKQNIGVIETAAVENYQKLSEINVKILLIIYCAYHPEKILVEWESKLVPFHNDKVKYGTGNASRTPYSNINLDDMHTADSFFKTEFGIEISKDTIKKLSCDIESQ